MYAGDIAANDPKIMIPAIQKNADALFYVGDQLKKNKDFVMRAVSSNGSALKWASKEVKNMPEVVLEAIKQDPNAMFYAGDKVKNDIDFILKAVTVSENILCDIGDSIRKNPSAILKLLKANRHAIGFADETIRYSEAFIRASEIDSAQLRAAACDQLLETLVNEKTSTEVRNNNDTKQSACR